MEAAVVSSVLKTLAPKIFSFLEEYHVLLGDLEHDIRNIRRELGMIDAAIEDHHRRSWRWSDGTNEAEKFWIQRVRDLAYSMQDCMDSFLPRVKGGGLKTTSVRRKFAKKIGELRKESEEVSRLREKYTGGGQASTSGASPPTSEVPERPAADLVGIDEPLDELLELMREDEGKPKQLKVISIVGLGGLGKTELARQVYTTVGEEYEPRVWVRASEKGAGDVLSEILRKVQVGMRVHDGYCDNLSECLRFKRFLIVIDDMRKEDCWNKIKYAFPKNMAVSSRVIVTTTIQSIANACSADNGHVYVMRTLDEEHSKRLFFKEACSEYYAPAEQVLKKCDGLPLALVTTAQFLQSKCQLTPEGCADLCRYLGERVEKEETLARMKHALLQSYYSLPDHVLKVFLLYLGIFPSGRPVRRKRLIRRWLAEGFVEADHRRVAIDNFKELMNRSIIQHVDMSNNTEAKTCQTHGMVLEFILHKSMCENFITLLYDQADRLPDKIRWLSLHHNGAADRLMKDIDLSLVRSLTIFGKADEHVLEFSKYKLLRVLDLEECETLNDEHVKNICNLLRLRYLSLGGNITMLPKEISKLKFLETLDVRSAREKILPIPIEVIELPCLIHLLGKFSFPDVRKEMKKLQDFLSEKSNLETLAGFVADQSPAFPQLMSHMNSLKKVKVWCEPTADGSNSFTHLSRPLQKFIQIGTKVTGGRSLSLSFEGCSQDFLDFRHEDNCCYLSLSSLKLHGELQRLPLFVTKLGSVTELCLSSPDQLSGDVLAALSNVSGLHYLKLITRQLDRFVIKQGELKNLRRLCIVVQSMACLENQEGALPQLESLWLLCKGLNGLCGAEIERLTRLKEVALDDGVSEKTKKEWKEAAKKHLKQPRVSLLERKDVDQNRMQMGVGSEPREVSESRAAPSPEVADIQRQVHRGSEDPAVHKKPAGMFGGLREANGRTSTVVSQEVDRHCYESRHLGGAGRGNFPQGRGWQDESRTEMHGRDGGPRREDNSRGNFQGGFGGRGDNPNPKLDRFRDNVINWESAGRSSKGDEQKKNWGETGPNTGVLRSEDRGTSFRCLQTGHHQARCSNPPVCYKCKKTGHMTSGCPEEKKNHGLKLCGFGIPGQEFYSLQIPGLQLNEKLSASGILSIKEGNASVYKIEAELKHLIKADWDWKVRKLSETDYAVVFPSKDMLESWSKARGVKLPLHSIKAKIDISHLDLEASSILTAAWIKVSGIPSPAKTVDIVKKIASTVGEPIEVDDISLLREDPVRVKVLSRDPYNINCFVEIFINSVGYEIKFESEGGAAGKKKGPLYEYFHKINTHKKKEDDEDGEGESEGSSHNPGWEKLAEKYGGDTLQSSKQKNGGATNNPKNKQPKDSVSEGEVVCSDTMVNKNNSQALEVLIEDPIKEDNLEVDENLDISLEEDYQKMAVVLDAEENEKEHLNQQAIQSESVFLNQCTSIVPVISNEEALQIVPLAFSLPLSQRGETEFELGVQTSLLSYEVCPQIEHQPHPVLLEPKQDDLLVHTERGPASLSASLWPCLQTPLKGRRSSVGQIQPKDIGACSDQSSVSFYPKKDKKFFEPKQWGDSDLDSSALEKVKDIFWEGDTGKESMVMTDMEGVTDDWISAKNRKGKKHKFLKPALATRKSSRIHDLGISMEKKAAKLKSIKNLEDKALECPPQKR